MLQKQVFKLRVTSSAGQVEVTAESPSCPLVGCSNEADVHIGGFKCRGLLDTGAMVTSVSEDFYRRYLEKDHPIQKLDKILEVEGMGGYKLPYQGFIEATVSVPDVEESVLVPVLISPDSSYTRQVPMIIGTNVLSYLNATSVRQVSLAWELAFRVLAKEHMVAAEVKVYAHRQIVIQPNHTILFQGKVQAAQGLTRGVVEACESLPGGLMMMTGVSDVDDNSCVKIGIKNISTKAITIPKNQFIAMCCQGAILDDGGFISGPIQASANTTAVNGSTDSHVKVDLDDALLTESQKHEVEELLNRWREAFAFSSTELGNAKGVKHSIQLTDEKPFKDRPRRIPPAAYDEVKKHLCDMLACGAIRHSQSPWSSNIVLPRTHP